MEEKREKRHRRSWSAAEKQDLLRRGRDLVASGSSWDAAAAAMGVWPSSLKRWHEQFPAEAAFRPVVVSATPQAAALPASVGVTIMTPDGFRIEGLDTDGAFLLLEGMRCSG